MDSYACVRCPVTLLSAERRICCRVAVGLQEEAHLPLREALPSGRLAEFYM